MRPIQSNLLKRLGLLIAMTILALAAVSCGSDDPVAPDPPSVGTIVVNPSPDILNAPWVLTGPDGYNKSSDGDQSLTGLSIGEYTLVWGDVTDYVTPAGSTQTLVADGTITFSGTYEEIGEVGTIVIDQTPDVLAGAGWTLSGPQAETGTGDSTLSEMPVGEYTLVWGDVTDHVTPPASTQTLVADGTITFAGTYEEIDEVGTIVIDQTPDGLVGAGWTLSGPQAETGTGDSTLSEMPVGDYTLTWDSVSGYTAPSVSQQTLANGETVTFSGVYSEDPGPVQDFVLIPPASVSMPVTFTMGSTVQSNETPHQVTLTGRFNMASTEVTNAQYVAALQWAYNQGHITATSVSVLDNLDGSIRELLALDCLYCYISFSEGVFSTSHPDFPVSEISWYGSVAYCDWLSLQDGLPRAYDHSTWSCNSGNSYTASGYRLPTEAEWEFACRAGTTTHFNTGDCLDSGTEANYNGQVPYPGCPAGPWPGCTDVGSYPANQWGLFDIHGSVWEWCNDWYGTYSGDETDPEGAGSGSHRVLRGGGFLDSAFHSRSACRGKNPPNVTDYAFGFRPVRSTQ